MAAAWPWILISVGALLATLVAIFLLRNREGRGRITPLTGLAFACIIGGMFFEARWIAYSLFAIGVVLAVADAMLQHQRAKQE